MPHPADQEGERRRAQPAPADRKPAKDAPVSPAEVARKPPTRQGGADAGQTADDPGRGGD